MKKKFLAMLLSVSMVAALALTGCGGGSADEGADAGDSGDSGAEASSYSVAMVTDIAGVNDQSFNQSAWEGLQQFGEETGAEVNYLESKQTSDYETNMDKFADQGTDLIWGIGYDFADAILSSAEINPELSYAIIDNAYDETPDNVTGVVFRGQEISFVVGYIAGKTTETDKVGFVGGMKSALIDQYEYGYKAGVDYAAKELGKTIEVSVQYAESYSDAAKGKAIASKMYSDGADVVFHAAGGTGAGVIEAAKEAGKYVIGADMDQSYMAPDNVLTSAMKLINSAIADVSKKAMDGEEIGGKTYEYGLAEGGVGIPEENPNMDDAVVEAVKLVEQDIIDGKVVPPYDEATYAEFGK